MVREVEALTEHPGFKGYIHDVGGPSATFRRPSLEVFLPEFLIDLDMGLAHIVQRVGHTVLRGHLQLPRDVVLDQVGEK